MSVIYAHPLLEAISTGVHGLRVVCHWWLVRSYCDQQEVRCYASLNLSRLRYGCQHCTLAVAQHCPSLIVAKCTRTFNFKYLNMHLKFTVYGHKQARTLQTHFRNSVPLVWGSLSLTPIIYKIVIEGSYGTAQTCSLLSKPP